MARGIHITGASGAGTTTLGRVLARNLNWTHLDTDEFYWLPTDPPFHAKRAVAERLQLLGSAIESNPDFVLSGSLVGWGDPLIPRFEAVIYIDTPTEVRLNRLRSREALRYGEHAIAPGGSVHTHYRDFLDWAAAYDRGTMEGRSRQRHEGWLSQLECR